MVPPGVVHQQSTTPLCHGASAGGGDEDLTGLLAPGGDWLVADRGAGSSCWAGAGEDVRRSVVAVVRSVADHR
jgi:hypothetical protein